MFPAAPTMIGSGPGKGKAASTRTLPSPEVLPSEGRPCPSLTNPAMKAARRSTLSRELGTPLMMGAMTTKWEGACDSAILTMTSPDFLWPPGPTKCD